MDKSDFQLASREESDGRVVYELLIPALGITRRYARDISSGHVEITGNEKKIIVRGYDMTSIIGKRAREWIAAMEEGRL
ncbi:hypothetical protein IT570_01355 [Candidatus Sumerlaeota bacterium]|nr:hypothetical protein [Candidatus Sumerlaeota bacterium]